MTNHYNDFYDLISPQIKDVGQVPLIKEALLYQLLADKLHIFVCGDPGASAKTSFKYALREIAPSYKYYSYSGHSTRVGLSQVIQRLKMGVLHVDEIGMAGGNDVSILRDVMQSQVLSINKHRNHKNQKVPINIYATANPKGPNEKWEEYGTVEVMRDQIPIPSSMYRRFHVSIYTRDYSHEEFDDVNRHKVKNNDTHLDDGDAEWMQNKILELRKLNPKLVERDSNNEEKVNVPEGVFEWLKVCKEFDGDIVMPITNELIEGVIEVVKANARLRESEELVDEDWKRTMEFFHKCFKTGGLNNKMVEDKLGVEV